MLLISLKTYPWIQISKPTLLSFLKVDLEELSKLFNHISTILIVHLMESLAPSVYVITPVKMNETPKDSGSGSTKKTSSDRNWLRCGEALEYPQPTQDIIAVFQSLWPKIYNVKYIAYSLLISGSNQQIQVGLRLIVTTR